MRPCRTGYGVRGQRHAEGRPVKTYNISITLTISVEAEGQTPQQIEDEVRSWLTGLRADVGTVSVKELP